MIYVFAGKTASGKTFLSEIIAKKLNLVNNIGYTTRPMRVGEIHGVHNFFVTNEEIEAMGNDIICKRVYHTAHGDWIYGMSLKSLQTNVDYVMILDPSGARELKELMGCQAKIIYIDVPYDVRYERAYSRESKTKDPEIERRFAADEQDFVGFEKDADVIIENIDKEKALKAIENFISQISWCEWCAK